ncbi:MAG: DUF6766 family protein [Bacteroidota bacterium]
MLKKKKSSFIYNNSLSIAFLTLTIVAITGQALTGWCQYNNFLKDHQQPGVSLVRYFSSGHFIQATFENWESEFFQMALFVWFTVFLRQRGSSESKQIGSKENVDREPKKHANAPWPVKQGGIILAVYKHSLSLSLITLFLVSFVLHWYGSHKDYAEKQFLEGKTAESMFSFLGNSKLWFESFQNWQSEFLSVFAIIFLSIYLREFGSPQSKPVDAPHSETGE